MVLALDSVGREKSSKLSVCACGVTVGAIARETSVSGGSGGRENQYSVVLREFLAKHHQAIDKPLFVV